MKGLVFGIASASVLACGPADASIIATYAATDGDFYSSATVSNSYSSAITQIVFDMVIDGGGDVSAPTPVFGDGNPGSAPFPTFSNPVPPTNQVAFFTATYSHISIAPASNLFLNVLYVDGLTIDG